jgi:hypothetical protein
VNFDFFIRDVLLPSNFAIKLTFSVEQFLGMRSSVLPPHGRNHVLKPCIAHERTP